MSPKAKPTPRTAAHRQRDASDPKRIIPVVILVVILAVAAGIAVLVGGEDGDGGASGAEGLVYADVELSGQNLPPLPEAGGSDPAAGQPAPTLEGSAPDGTPVNVDFEEPTLVAFLAHWCPHCQAELPHLVDLAEDGTFDGMEAVVVLTGTDPAAPNFPPTDWLRREGWDGTVLVDEEDQAAGAAYGLSSYPYLVLVDEGGEVIGRVAGEQGIERLRAFVQRAG